MARDEDRRPSLGDILEQRGQNVTAHDGIESVRGLVEDQQLSPLRQGEQDHELRLLAFRQPPEQALLVELELAEQLLCPRSIPGGIESGLEVHGLADGEGRIEMRLLGHIAHPGEHARGVVGHALAENRDLASLRTQQPQHQSDRRRLAGAVGTEEPVDRPGRDMQVEVPDLEPFPWAIAQVLELDRVRHGVFTPISSSIAACSSASDTPMRRASASSLWTRAVAWRARSRARRAGASSRTNVPAP